MPSVIAAILACAMFADARPDTASERGQLAVLAIENTTGAHRSFVDGLPDMVVTELVNKTGETVVERLKVQKAMDELRIQASGLATEGNRKLGRWIGAERVVLGSLNSYGQSLRLDLRLIEVETGRILAAASSTAALPEDLLRPAMDQLLPLLRPKPKVATEPPPVPVLVRTASEPVARMGKRRVDSGTLVVGYRTVLSLLTEQKVPFQVVRVYLDGKWLTDGPFVDAVDKDFVLCRLRVPEGEHELRLEHWIADGKGRRLRLLGAQPPPRQVRIEADEEVRVDYRMKVQVVGFSFFDR